MIESSPFGETLLPTQHTVSQGGGGQLEQKVRKRNKITENNTHTIDNDYDKSYYNNPH